jgi:hypothetical protein
VISHIRGAGHCGWQEVEFITISKPLGAAVEYLSADSANRYLWNAGGVIDGLSPGQAIARSNLSTSAVHTGYVQREGQLGLDSGNVRNTQLGIAKIL